MTDAWEEYFTNEYLKLVNKALIDSKIYGKSVVRRSDFNKLKRQFPLIILIDSLEKDGRFYSDFLYDE